MSISPTMVRFDDDCFWVELQDGRTLGVPLVWFPRLLNATAEQRQAFKLSPHGIHWDELDEDIAIDGLLAGFGDLSQSRHKAA